LVAVLFAGAIATIGILPATHAVTTGNWFGSLPPMLNFTLKTFCVFFIPPLILSMASPLAIKLTLADIEHTGGVVGTIYAVSTMGAILGTFMTGFYFILWFGLSMIVWLVAGVLILTGIVAWFSWRVPDRWKISPPNLVLWTIMIVVVIAAMLLFQFRDRWQENYTRESNYYSIIVRSEDGNVQALSLDHLVNSFVIPDNPTYLGYSYLKVFADIVRYVNEDGHPITALHLGGGGYSFPRYLEAIYPGSLNEVVEIDPAVTEVAYDKLGLPRDTTIKTYNVDARQFLVQRTSGLKYDVVVGDVCNNYLTPYHLTTLEFDRLVKANVAQDGIYLLNIMDSYQHGHFLPSVIRTLKQTFNNVYLFGMYPNWDYSAPTTYVVVATDRYIDLADFTKFTTKDENELTNITPLDEDELDRYIIERGALLLTDDYAPTDILQTKIRH
jgi:predicted membrane-bound spermidine synthase